MTKKEKAIHDAEIERCNAEIERLKTDAALRWTDPVEPDLAVPKTGFTQGWSINVYTFIQGRHIGDCVHEAWSESTRNGWGKRFAEGQLQSAAQGGTRLYSTRIRAMKALRHAAEQKTAERLRQLDSLISAAQQEQDSIPK